MNIINNVKCYINNVERDITDELSITQTLSHNNKSTFEVVINNIIFSPKPKDRVKIIFTDDIGIERTIFWGKIEQIETPELLITTKVWRIKCSALPINSVFVDRNIAESFQDNTAEDVIRYIIDNYMNSENIITGLDVDWTYLADVKVDKIAFPDIPVYDAMSTLATQTNCMWWIDNEGILHFVKNKDAFLPIIEINRCEDFNYQRVKLTLDTLNSRNTQIISGFQDNTSQQTQTFNGDGKNNNYNVLYRIKEEPKLTVIHNGQTIEVDQKYVRQRGEEMEDTIWTWQYNSPTITQIADGQNYPKPLGTTDKLKVQYFGFINRKIVLQDEDLIKEYKTRCGGTGLIEWPFVDKSIESSEVAINQANQLLEKYKEPKNNLSWTMLSNQRNIELGSTLRINIGDVGLIGDFKVYERTISAYAPNEHGNWVLKYDYKATSGEIEGYAKQFKKIDDYRITLLINEDSVIIKEIKLKESFGLTEWVEIIITEQPQEEI